MANPDHIEWLREGVEAWNARRKKKDFTLDFSEAHIYVELEEESDRKSSSHLGPSLEGINLRNAIFNKTELCGLRFKGADLNYAQLVKANLIGANFSDTSLINTNFNSAHPLGSHVNFAGAYLWHADLQGIRFIEADFTNANLNEAKVKKAYFYRVDANRCRYYWYTAVDSQSIPPRREGYGKTGSNIFGKYRKHWLFGE